MFLNDVVPFEPTTENVARFVYDIAVGACPDVASVTVSDADVSVTYSQGDGV